MEIRNILPVYSNAKIIDYKNSLHAITFLFISLEPATKLFGRLDSVEWNGGMDKNCEMEC